MTQISCVLKADGQMQLVLPKQLEIQKTKLKGHDQSTARIKLPLVQERTWLLRLQQEAPKLKLPIVLVSEDQLGEALVDSLQGQEQQRLQLRSKR